MRFTINGTVYVSGYASVRARMQLVKPDPIHKYYVIVNRVRYTPNQVLQRITGLTRVECKTLYSVPILHRLGFKIHRI